MPSHLPTDVSAEFYIDGAWTETYSGTDLAARVRGADQIRITRGLVDQQSSTSPVSTVFTLNNADGIFTDDNPSSPLFGKLPLNSKCRVGVKTGGLWDCHLLTPDRDDDDVPIGYMSTADKASLDIVGDIDVRIEITPRYPRNGAQQCLVSKYLTTGNQRAWLWMMKPDGNTYFVNSTTGADINTTVSGAVQIPEQSKRCALRVTVDVNDGAGNRVFKFYTSDSATIAGPWTLVSTGTFAGVTTIFSSSSPLELGSASGGGAAFGGAVPFRGKIHACEVYSGIAGTKVLDFKPATRAPEDVTWADGCASPNTYAFVNNSMGYTRLASDRIRATVEMTSVPDDWDTTGRDIRTPVTGAGILQRYSGNKAALASPLYRYNRLQTGVKGYWPGEGSAWTPIPGAFTGVMTGCTTGATTGLDGSDGAITMTTSPTSSLRLVAGASVSGPGTGTASFVFYFNLTALPASDQVFCTAFATSGATASEWRFSVGATGYAFACYDSSGTLVDSGSSLFGTGASPLNQWIAMSVQLTTETTNVRWQTQWHAVGTTTFYSHFGGGDTYAGSVGQFYALNFATPDAAFSGAQVAHAKFTTTTAGDLVNLNTAAVSSGWAGETALDRMIRLSNEEGFAFEWRGLPAQTPMMGPQAIDTLYNNLTAAAAVDGGLLSEIRDKLGARYVARTYLGNRTGLTLAYGDSEPYDIPRPIRDNRYTVNDFTATRPAGGSRRYQVTDTQLKNISDPPVGAGRWERTGAFNVDTDDQLDAMAQKQTALGAWPERRVPNLSVALHRTEIFSDTTLLDACIQQDFGDSALLTDLVGSPIPPNDLLMVTYGYTETINNHLWEIVGNTVPAGPFQVPIFDDYITTDVPRMDATDSSHSLLKASVTTTATSFVVKTVNTGTYPTTRWVDATNYASDIGGGVTLNIVVAGEVMTVSSIGVPSSSGGFNEQTFTINARSVNGIVKAHSALEPVFLAQAYYLGEI